MKKNKQSTLVCTSQVNLLTQHIVWEFKSIPPHESMLLTATALIHRQGEDVLSPSMEKAGSEVSAETVPARFILQGDHQED